MPEFIFNGTPEQLADIVTRLNKAHTPDMTVMYGEVYPTEFRASVIKHTVTNHSMRFIIGVANGNRDSWSECFVVAAIRPDGKTRVSTERVDGDWSQFESSWQILMDELERDGWIGEAPDPAPVVDDELTKDRKFYNWAYVEIYLRGENPDDVFDNYLKYVLGIDLFDLDTSKADRLRNNFDSAMSTRKTKYGG